MEKLPAYMRRAIRKYEPIETDGMTLYPALVRDYDDFAVARAALTVMQQAFPVRLMSKPLLQALYTIDREKQQAGEPLTGLFSAAILCLVLALRLGEDGGNRAAMERVRLALKPGDSDNLQAVLLERSGGGKIQITPVQFQRLREIIAAQNGIDLPDPQANPELVQAERDIADRNSPKVNASIERMITSVAALCGADEAEIDDWPIKKLMDRSAALKRAMDYFICGVAENQGTKWKRGNPHPHPFFERTDLTGGAHVSLSSFAGGEGAKAVQRAGGA